MDERNQYSGLNDDLIIGYNSLINQWRIIYPELFIHRKIAEIQSC